MSTLCSAINKALQLAPGGATEMPYGTAGFRCEASKLPHAMVRCGMLAVVRSLCHGGLPVGVCVTASHNPASDNGVKIVEPDGGMLVPAFETYVTNLVNSRTPFAVLESLVREACHVELSTASEDLFKRCRVVVASDTRPSSPTLTELVTCAVKSLGAAVINVGVATTPMLHWTVATRHDDVNASKRTPEELHEAYYNFWVEKATEFAKLMPDRGPEIRLYADAACGVGSTAFEGLRPAFEALNCKLELRNKAPTPTLALNDHCGAEFVQKSRRLPANFGKCAGDAPGSACVAVDGDADRVVFFTIPSPEEEEKPLATLIDGDRIAAVLGTALLKMLKDVEADSQNPSKGRLTFAVVQTGYANSASSHFLKNLPMPRSVTLDVPITKTGVKNVHHKAIQYDIGIYFESNGHGTVTHKAEALTAWAEALDVVDKQSFLVLKSFLDLIDEYVGDAIIDALATIGALRYLNYSFETMLSLYEDLKVVQNKVPLPRAVLNTLKSHPEHELHLVEPQDLQDKINVLVKAHAGARAFVRASGTEDACRIYSEHPEQKVAEQIAAELAVLLEQL